MKFRNQARICLAIYDFEAHMMLSLFLTFLSYRTTRASAENFSGGEGNGKKDLKIVLLSFYLLYICTMFENPRGATTTPPLPTPIWKNLTPLVLEKFNSNMAAQV